MNRGKDFIWAYMLKIGTNMWCDTMPQKWMRYKPEHVHYKMAADHLRCDDALWRDMTEKAAAAGFNMLLIDLGEGIQYPSHPELAVKGSWSVEKLQAELRRLRSMGLEPIPKMNFSTGHDTWLGEYARMVSTSEYYRVCSDLIRDAAEIFGTPRFLHLGYDEENFSQQQSYNYACVRSGELWWHDFLWFVKQVESHGVRAWIWSDRIWDHKEEFLARMPRSVLQSNWYYLRNYSLDSSNPYRRKIDAFRVLEKAGFDQLPTSSTNAQTGSFRATVEFCDRNIAPERLKGYLMSAWRHTVPDFRSRLEDSIEDAAPVIAKSRSTNA